MEHYTAGHMMKVLDMSRTSFNGWVQRGVVKPTVAADGPGTKAYYDIFAVRQALIIQKLKMAKISLKMAAKISGLASVIAEGKLWYDIETAEHGVDNNPPEVGCLLTIDLEIIERELQRKLAG